MCQIEILSETLSETLHHSTVVPLMCQIPFEMMGVMFTVKFRSSPRQPDSAGLAANPRHSEGQSMVVERKIWSMVVHLLQLWSENEAGGCSGSKPQQSVKQTIACILNVTCLCCLCWLHKRRSIAGTVILLLVSSFETTNLKGDIMIASSLLFGAFTSLAVTVQVHKNADLSPLQQLLQKEQVYWQNHNAGAAVDKTTVIIIIYHHHLSSSFIIIIYHHHLSSSFIIIIYHHHLSSSFIIIIYHHHLSSSLSASSLSASSLSASSLSASSLSASSLSASSLSASSLSASSLSASSLSASSLSASSFISINHIIYQHHHLSAS
eukprot:g57711.t1